MSLTLRERGMRTAVAVHHLAKSGRTAPRHYRHAGKLLAPVLHRSVPDLREAAGREVCANLTLAGMALERGDGSLVLEMTDSLLELPAVIRDELAGAQAVTLRFKNALGGSGEASRELLQALKGKTVVSEVLDYAASAHAFVAICHPGRRRIHRNAELLIHAPADAVLSTWRGMQEAARKLRAMTDVWVRRISRRSGRPPAEVRAWLSVDTVFTGKDAVAAGLADELFG